MNKDEQEVIKEISLLYATINNQNSLLVRQATDDSSNKRTQHVINKAPALNNIFTS